MTTDYNQQITDALTLPPQPVQPPIYKYKQLPCKSCKKPFERLKRSLNCETCANDTSRYLKSLRNARYYSKKNNKPNKSVPTVLLDQKINTLIEVKKQLDSLLGDIIATREAEAVLPQHEL